MSNRTDAPEVLLSAATKASIALLVSQASIPGAERLTDDFCTEYGLRSRPTNDEEGKARVALFKFLMPRQARWGKRALVAAGLAFPVPRAVPVKGEEGEPSHPCISCRVAGLRCTITVIEQGLSVSNYCKPCSIAHGRCSFRDEKRNSVVSRGTLIGMSIPSLRTQLKQLGTDADGALTTMERLIEDVLLLFQETVPLAHRTIQTALNPPDTASRGRATAAAAVANPPSVLGRGHLAPRSIDRSQRGKKRPRSRTSASPEKDNYGTSRGNLRRDSGLGADDDYEDDAVDDDEDDDDYEEEVTTPSRLTKSRSRR